MDGRPNSQELKNACLTLNTADYCLMISSQVSPYGMSRFVRIADSALWAARGESERRYRRQVSGGCIIPRGARPVLRVSLMNCPLLSPYANLASYPSVISACLLTILRELESACEPALAAILKTPWANVENVLGRSAYVVDLVGSIKSVAEVVRERVEQKKYIKSFADKAVG